MRAVGVEGLSLDEFEAREADRLRGNELLEARGTGNSLVVAYEDRARKFDTTIAHVGKSTTGLHVVTLSAVEPASQLEFYLTLKARNGKVPQRGLDDPWLQTFGERPHSAHLYREGEIDPEAAADLTPEDEARFHELYIDHRDSKMHSSDRSRGYPHIGILYGIVAVPIPRLGHPRRP